MPSCECETRRTSPSHRSPMPRPAHAPKTRARKTETASPARDGDHRRGVAPPIERRPQPGAPCQNAQKPERRQHVRPANAESLDERCADQRKDVCRDRVRVIVVDFEEGLDVGKALPADHGQRDIQWLVGMGDRIWSRWKPNTGNPASTEWFVSKTVRRRSEGDAHQQSEDSSQRDRYGGRGHDRLLCSRPTRDPSHRESHQAPVVNDRVTPSATREGGQLGRTARQPMFKKKRHGYHGGAQPAKRKTGP